MQEYLHDAALFGVESKKAIIAVAPMFPVVHAYSVTGRLLWKKTVAGFRQIKISQINENQMLITTPPSGYQSFSNAFAVSASILSVQTLLNFPADSALKSSPRVETRFLSLEDGRELAKVNDAPAIIAALRSNLYGVSSTAGGFQRFRAQFAKTDR
jgi:hypothetical protein